MIELKHLTKIYPSAAGETVALEDVSLEIPDGSVYGVIGLSGAGKSTLVRCINLLERPTSGQVLVDGKDLMTLKKGELNRVRRSIGMIFQGFNLLQQRTAEGNVLFPLELAKVPRAEAKKRAKELLELVGLGERARSYPSQLSGGQKQRVAIARALATEPKYLLCDEATSALDPATTESVLQLLEKINRELGVTIVVITHEMKVAERICTDVAVLDRSRVAEQGKVADVFAFPRSEIAKQLILPGLLRSLSGSGKKLRLVFRGERAAEPVISGLALRLGISVNILFADTRSIGGKAYGQMVIDLPQEEEKAVLVKRHLAEQNITFKEEDL